MTISIELAKTKVKIFSINFNICLMILKKNLQMSFMKGINSFWTLSILTGIILLNNYNQKQNNIKIKSGLIQIYKRLKMWNIHHINV